MQLEERALQSRSHRAMVVSLALVVLVACVVALTAGGPAFGSAGSAAGKPSECTGVAKGLPWSKGGKKGTSYTVIGVSGASCTLGGKWLLRITSSKGAVVSGPPGWSCLVASAQVGECTTKAGGIFEWTPKLG